VKSITTGTPVAQRYRVWAPSASDVQLEINDQQVPLQPADGGWWISNIPAEAGDRYAYRLDGTGPFPDPRSASQPSGVHGPSTWIAHEFPWTDQTWQPPPLSSGVLYEIHIGTFTDEGTFAAAIGRLNHLVELGVTHVELMPVVEWSGNRGWGYDGVDFFAPHRAYGGPTGLKQFVDACHAHRLAVILDVVYNHAGPCGNYLSRFGPYFTNRYQTPWGQAVNLDDAGSDEVRRFFADSAAMWFREYHVDGLRLDAVHALIDSSSTHFMRQLASETAALEAELGRHLCLIAESDLNDPRVVEPLESGGFGMDAQWSDDFHHAVHAVITGERAGYYEDFGRFSDIADALQQAFVYSGRYSRHRGRVHGRAPAGISGGRFVVSIQNHDQIGNRARGERLGHLVSPERVKIAAALLFMSPFVPMLFQGEEWGASSPFLYFTSHEDQWLGDAVRDGRRREFAAFGWAPEAIPDPQDESTWRRSQLCWDELSQPAHDDMLGWYRALIALRRDIPSLRDGNYRACGVDFDEASQWLTLRRRDVVLACNLSTQVVEIPLDGGSSPPRLLAYLRLASTPGVGLCDGRVRLPAESCALFVTSEPTP
jgi:maltooligosyltrehalose trehalohydrolase